MLKRAPNQPEAMLTALYGGVYVKAYRVADAGTIIPQHAHTYDHISFLARGSVIVSHLDGETGALVEETRHAPAAIRIPARVKHSFFTLSDDALILCVHNAAHGEAAEIHEEHALALEDR